MSTLTKLLHKVQKQKNFSLAKLAKAIGVSTVSLRGALAGTSTPNRTTAGLYAEFLNVSVEAILGGTSRNSTTSKPKKKRAIRTQKVQEKRGAVEPAMQVLQAIVQDELAVAVHRASAVHRDLLAKVLSVIGAHAG